MHRASPTAHRLHSRGFCEALGPEPQPQRRAYQRVSALSSAAVEESEERTVAPQPFACPGRGAMRDNHEYVAGAEAQEDMDSPVEHESVKSFKSLVAGGIAGMVAKTTVAPLDRTKILFQVTNEKYKLRKIPRIMSQILQNEGVVGLWKGNSATLLRVFPYSGIQFMTYETLKRYIMRTRSSEVDKSHPTASLTRHQSMICGGAAAGISSFCTYPLDLARARFAVTARDINAPLPRFVIFRNLYSWLKMYGIRELYRGVTATLLGVIPYGAIAFSINERGKAAVRKFTGKEPEVYQKLAVGAVAGLTAQSCTYPFEVVRRRMQTAGFIDKDRIASGYTSALRDSLSPVERQQVTFLRTLKDIVRVQGVMGLYKGLSLNWFKGPISISISFTTFDLLNRHFQTNGGVHTASNNEHE